MALVSDPRLPRKGRPVRNAVIGILAIFLVIRVFTALNSARTEERAMLLSVLDGIQVDYILTPSRADQLPLPLGSSFGVTGEGNIVMRAGNMIIEMEVGPDGLAADRVQTSDAPPDSFAIDKGNTLLAISGQFFGQLEDSGYTKAIPLPAVGMQLQSSSTPGAVYLFGGDERTSRRVYILYEDAKLDILAELPSPVVAVADNRQAIYVATVREIYRATLRNFHLVFRLPEDRAPIVSIAASPDDQVLYFATRDRVHALHGTAAMALVRDAGGKLQMQNGKLYLWDPNRRLLVSLSGLERALFGGKE